MFGALKKRFTDNLDSVLGKYASDKNLLEAAMAACAMMAAADGEIEPKEKAKTADFIRKHESMRHFDQQEASRLFTRYADGFDLDFDMGADECLKQIGDIKDPDKANLVARVAMMVAKSDGDFEPQEKTAYRRIIERLGLSPSEYGV